MRSLCALALVVLSSTLGASPAGAGEVFVNGVKIYRLSGVSLEGCTVTFDANGNVQISAPGYEIRVQEPPPAPAYAPPAAPVAPTYAAPTYAPPTYPPAAYVPAPAPVPAAPAPAAPGYGAPGVPVAPVAVAPSAPSAQAYAAPVAPAPAPAPAAGRPGFALTTWAQQTITLPLKYELAINGTVVRAFSAADEALVLDLAPYLVSGPNTVRLTVEYDSMYSGVPPTAADRYAVRIQFGRFSGTAFTAERSLVEFTRDGTQMLGTIKEFQITL